MKGLRLVIATRNRKKLRELEELLSGLPVELLPLDAFPGIDEVEETGKTFLENAQLKAQGYARQTLSLTLAEDSGLCCDALEGAPGIYSARFAGLAKNDDDNNEKVLKLLSGVPDNCRDARFVSAIAVSDAEGRILGAVEGEVRGSIAREVRGNGGFGYDPVFFYPPFQKTFGEVSAEDKHRVSHRYKSLQKAKILLEGILRNQAV